MPQTEPRRDGAAPVFGALSWWAPLAVALLFFYFGDDFANRWIEPGIKKGMRGFDQAFAGILALQEVFAAAMPLFLAFAFGCGLIARFRRERWWGLGLIPMAVGWVGLVSFALYVVAGVLGGRRQPTREVALGTVIFSLFAAATLTWALSAVRAVAAGGTGGDRVRREVAGLRWTARAFLALVPLAVLVGVALHVARLLMK